MSKLWDKGVDLNELIEEFTVGEDHLLDRRLVASDCLASLAHARMLHKIGILTTEEFESLSGELAVVIRLSRNGEFTVSRQEEDCHSAIENHLVEALGEVGKKIHTGRSRNDQVIAALRLYTRDFLFRFQDAVLGTAGALLDFAEKHRKEPMPGRTHLQIAMPSSLGLWAGAYAEELLDDLQLVEAAAALNDSCPLGSAASYGVPLPLDRELVAGALGFARVQNNVLYVNNSRGKYESIVLEAVSQVMLTLSKLAQDIILFSLPEFGYFRLPDDLFSGSSIMPQKKNPCMLELLRAKTASVCAAGARVKEIIRALPSGYNRDFQETKGPFLHGLDTGLLSVRMMQLVIEKLTIDVQRLRHACRPEIYATDRALEMVAAGTPFRDAYRTVGAGIEGLKRRDPVETILSRTYTGTTGNPGLELAGEVLEKKRKTLRARREAVDGALEALAGFAVSVSE